RPPTTTTTTLPPTTTTTTSTTTSTTSTTTSTTKTTTNTTTTTTTTRPTATNISTNSAFVKQVLAPGTTTSDPGMAASTVYTYNVAAIDNAGNTSGMSVAASTNTPACVAGGQFIWNRQIGGSGVFDAAHAMAVATDPSGNVA